MKKQLGLLLLTLVSFSLILACSTNSNTPAPTSPVVGQFDINRVELTDFPTSFTIYNSVVTSATALGSDTYLFNADNTYSDNYTYSTPNSTSTNSETGSYVYAPATQVVALTPAAQNGQAVQPYMLLYSSTANELSTGKIARQDSVPNPVTGKNQWIAYNVNYVYKKR